MPWPRQKEHVTIHRIKTYKMFITILRFLAIISPFPFYFYLWNWPQSFVSQFPEKPSHSMSLISNGLKVLQLLALGSTWHSSNVRWWNLILIFAGQFLNFRVYQLLGEVGVYYGVRFGYSVPWVTEFPYVLSPSVSALQKICHVDLYNLD